VVIVPPSTGHLAVLHRDPPAGFRPVRAALDAACLTRCSRASLRCLPAKCLGLGISRQAPVVSTQVASLVNTQVDTDLRATAGSGAG